MVPPELPAKPYRLLEPEHLASGVIFASPHSGRDYPAAFLGRSVLDERRLRSSEDAFVDRLLRPVPELGATLLLARYPRAYVDLNRAEDELDPALIEGLTRPPSGARVLAGLGVIPRVVAGGKAIYSGKLARDEAEARLAQVWRPYHARLGALMQARRARFGKAVLFDVHSMPSEALETLGPARPDVVLGDRFGTTAEATLMEAVERIFRGAGLRVSRNTPFAGAYIAQHYGRPVQGTHVVQIELNRALYMDEARVRPRPDFETFAALIGRICGGLAGLVPEPEADGLAAE